ncbi:MAG: hypothetical protein FD166_3739, partial [Bacteroidetes bacterium]
KHIAVTCISPALPAPEEAGGGNGLRSIQSLFGKDSLFILSIQDENRIDYSSLSSQQVIILSGLRTISSGLAQELSRFVLNGRSLLVFPPAETDTGSYKNFLSSLGTNFYLRPDTANTKIDWVNFESEIFSDVFDKKGEHLDLPLVHSHFPMSRSSRTNEEILLKMRNGDPFFSKYNYKKGTVYLCAVPLDPDWSNFPKHAIFVPLLYKIGVNSQPSSGLFYSVGAEVSIPARTKLTGENVFKIKGDEHSPITGNFEVIPETRMIDLQPTIFVHDQVKDAGSYLLQAGTETISGISFNYDRKESDLSRYSADELITLYEKTGLSNFSLIDAGDKDITKVLADISKGVKLWKWCIGLVLLFLAFETVLLRLWK